MVTVSTHCYFKFSLLTSTNYSVVGVYQSAHMYMAPGIEPGNLIRSTLIRSLPGPFFKNIEVTRLQA